MKSVRAATALIALVLPGCTAELVMPDDRSRPASSTGGAEGTGGAGTGAVAASDLPCAVQALLTQSCQGCHGASSAIPLVSRADLAAPSAHDSTLTLAQASLLRMTATDREQMPPLPAPPPTGAEIEAFEAWVRAGTPVGSCSDEFPPPVDPYDTPVVCTSGSYWTGGDRESPDMNPGQACISCHTNEGEGPELTIAGTLYPTAHEPSDCNGSGASDAYVEITDASGRIFQLELESSGNFMLEDPDAFTMPYTAKVVSAAGERVMVSEQDDGDCNSCHTEGGAEAAPGRIMLP